jgi:transcriptional regulator with XRE-family HTH domain
LGSNTTNKIAKQPIVAVFPLNVNLQYDCQKEDKFMEESFGQRIARLRKGRGLTQEELGDKVGVTSQAVSKWETDISAPDVMILVKLADILGVSVDSLLGSEHSKETTLLVPVEERKDINRMTFKITIDSSDGDKVRINLPMSLVKLLVEDGSPLPEINGKDTLKNVQWNQIFTLIEQGVIGKLVEIESSDGDIVNIAVE